MSLPFVVAFPADHYACGRYRLIDPFQALRDAGLIDGLCSDFLPSPSDLAQLAPDVLVFQRILERDQIARVKAYRTEPGLACCRFVMDLDDLIWEIPHSNRNGRRYYSDAQSRFLEAASAMDSLIVSTPALKRELDPYHKDVRVVLNSLPESWIFPPLRSAGPVPRVGWAGGSGHLGDLKILYPVVRELADQVHFVFLGDIPGALAKYAAEVHPGVPIYRYPEMLASLSLDIGLAPLVDDRYNACKSALRLLELGSLGVPIVASCVPAFSHVQLPGVELVDNSPESWIRAIRSGLTLDGFALQRAIMQDWRIGSNLHTWLGAWHGGGDHGGRGEISAIRTGSAV